MSKRTRTKRTNNRAPVKLSKLAPDEYNVRPGEQMTIVCRDCGQWRRVMGATTLKVIEHGTRVCPDTRQITRGTCPGSRQLVVVDIDVAQWLRRQNRLVRDELHAQLRGSAPQFSKPAPPSKPALAQMANPRPKQRQRPRPQQWARVLPAVKLADKARTDFPAGDAPAASRTDVPLEPPRIAV